MTTVNWPSFFPPKCPPSEAKDASAEVFRLVYSTPHRRATLSLTRR